MKFLKNKSGFSLIEILIAIGLMGALSAWMMDIFKQQTKNEKATAANMDIDSTGQEIRNIVADGLSCEKTFKGTAPVKDSAVTEIKKVLSDGNSQPRFKVNDAKIGNSALMIASYDLKADDIYFIPQGKKSGDTVLIINYDRGKNVTGSKTKSFKVPLTVSLDDAGNILDCHALASTTNLESLCNALGRSVDSNKKKCGPAGIYLKGDTPVYQRNYNHCEGGGGSGEKTLGTWTSAGEGSVRISWSGLATDNQVIWRFYKNSTVLSTQAGGGGAGPELSSEMKSVDLDVKKGDIVKHTVTLSGGYDNDCVTGGNISVGMDLLNM